MYMARRLSERQLAFVKNTMQRAGLYEFGILVGERMRELHPDGQQLHINELHLSQRLGKKIVVIADIHADPRSVDEEKIREIGQLAASIEDVWFYAFVGDYVNDDHAEMIHPICDMIRTLPAPSIMVWGNHDYRAGIDAMAGPLQAAGAHMLRNESMKLDGIDIVGVDCWTVGCDDTAAAIAGCSDPYIVLGHEPYLATLHDGFLHIAGHTHHGQFKVGERPMFMPRGSMPYPAGHYPLADDRHVYTSSGIGYSVVSARFSVQPEIAVLHV